MLPVSPTCPGRLGRGLPLSPLVRETVLYGFGYCSQKNGVVLRSSDPKSHLRISGTILLAHTSCMQEVRSRSLALYRRSTVSS